jgi:hypothetical protein
VCVCVCVLVDRCGQIDDDEVGEVYVTHGENKMHKKIWSENLKQRGHSKDQSI